MLICGKAHDEWVWFFTVCQYPSDWPDFYTVRPHASMRGQQWVADICCLCDSLEEACAALERYNMIWFPRHGRDDPVIVGSYML